MAIADVTISVPGNHLMVDLLGQRDELLRLVEAAFPDVTVHVRGNEINVVGPGGRDGGADQVARTFTELVRLLQSGQRLDGSSVRRAIDMVRADESPADILGAEVLRASGGRVIRPKSSGQKRYVDAIRENVITFGIGPAGTGKSWLAVACAVQALNEKQVDRIILTRPAVEAGERLGFLPGDLMAKVDPYLRPLYDALHDMVGLEGAQKLLERGAVEVAPLAFMRGRAMPYDRRVLTPSGWRYIGELELGDLVIGSNGEPTAVLGIYPRGRREVFTVRAQDGAETVVCGEHLWAVKTASDTRRGRPWRILETQEMIGKLRSLRRRRFELPVVAPVHFDHQPVPMDAYELGLMLGDGAIGPSPTPGSSPAAPERARALPAATRSPVAVAVRDHELAGTRSAARLVPREYLVNRVEVRVALLQGLLDADGAPVIQAGRGCYIEYSTTSPRLRDDVLFLVRSLGGIAYTGARRSDSFRLDIRLPEAIQPFRLRRKREVYERIGGRRPRRFVDSIEPAGVRDTMCIRVAAPDSLYVTDDFLVTHNTLNGSFIICDEAQNTTPEQMKMFLTRIGFGSKAVVTGDVTQVDVPGGRSGLLGLEDVLTGIDGLSWVRLSSGDVVRHRIVQDIVDAYERAAGR